MIYMKKRVQYTIASVIISVLSFVLIFKFMGKDLAIQLGLVLILIPGAVYFQFKERKLSCSPEILMNEAPTIIGMMSTTLMSSSSLDSAIRDISDNGPKNISEIFKKIVMDADCRAMPDISSGVKDFLSSLPKEISSFRRAVDIMITAFESSNIEERKGMMKDAENIVLTGLKQMGESYSSKLSSPCMLIFGLGVMVPMILVSILPMLSISSNYGASIFDSKMISFITLICVPAIVAVIIISMKGKNPFFELSKGMKGLVYVIPLLSAIPLFIYQMSKGVEMDIAIICSAVPVGLFSFVLMVPEVLKERKRIKMEEMLKDSLFELGNRLLMGENFEVALERSFATRTDCTILSESVLREITISRGDIEGGLHKVLDPISLKMAEMYCDIYRSSVKDVRDGGRLAGSIAHQLQDQNGVRKSIENKLKSMLDMMTGTSAIFAPIILGMSVVMLDPLSQIAGITGLENVSVILAVYLIELSALIAFLSSNLICKGGIMDIVYRFNLMMPAALIVFYVCSSITL